MTRKYKKNKPRFKKEVGNKLTSPVKKNNDIFHKAKILDTTPRDKGMSKLLDEIHLPEWLKEVELLIRQQEKINAIKLFKQKSGFKLIKSKDAIEDWIKKGYWDNNYVFIRPERLDLAFTNIMGLNIHQAKEKWIEDKDKLIEFYKKNDLPCISIESALEIAKEYVEIIYKESKLK